MNNNKKEIVQYTSAVGMLIFGCVLVTLGFYEPPRGEVSNSVLGVFGQCIIFAAGIFGVALWVDYRIDRKLKDRLDNPK